MTSSHATDSSQLALTRAVSDAHTHALVRRARVTSRALVRTGRVRPGHASGRAPRLARVAVVGGGAAGIAAAYELTRRGFDVELFEASPRLGGNCERLVVPGADGSQVPIDIGVSDFNRRTFHRFGAFVDALGLEARSICEDATTLWSDATTATTTLSGGDKPGPTASAALSSEIARFTRALPGLLTTQGHDTLGDYMTRMGYSEAFKTLYARPRAAGCIVMPGGDPDRFDVRALARFWQMHGLIGSRPRERMHLVGGMWTYCEAFARWFRARGGVLRIHTRVVEIKRGARGVRLTWATRGTLATAGEGETFGVAHVDHVVVAVDASQVQGLVTNLDEDERRALASVRYAIGEVVVHRDTRVMPRDRRHWAAYNFYATRPGEAHNGPSITFYPHRLAGVAGAEGVFVSLNPRVAPREILVLARRRMVHPIAEGTEGRAELFERIQGRRGTWYAGGYLEAPCLHEQAFRSGARVAQAMADRHAREPAPGPVR